MRLADIIATNVTDMTAPAAALALVYAERIDEANHVGMALADALELLRQAAMLADEANTADRREDANLKAWRKVSGALAAVTVASDLGPKLLATLDALLVTPKARAAAGQAITPPSTESPVAALRKSHGARRLRAVS